ncbi:2,3-bisphosphoglycerate-independent phosphoglycerate mutase [Candidatus Latescibacterota bacterium]
MRTVCVIVRDGWGYNENPQGNAVLAANTPNIDSYKEKYPWELIKTSGEAVGLPDGYQGSSEVGHLNMGAGRVVIQELKRIDDLLSDGTFFQSPKWIGLVEKWRLNQSQLHLLCLLQDEGVHAHQEHLFKIMRRARLENPEGKIVIHPFLDGRDTPPRSCLGYLATLDNVVKETGNCIIGSIMGRYYAMDRSENWSLSDIAYKCIVNNEGRLAQTSQQAVKESYDTDKTPDGVDMFDEYIPPYIMQGYKGVNDNDCVIHVNYRQDRAIQLSKAFIDPNYQGDFDTRPDVFYLGITRYYDEFPDYLMEPINETGEMDHLLGQVVSEANMNQLRIAETQKFRHVTSFFNGKSTNPYEFEEDIEVPSRFDPSTFASHPEMEAYNVTDILLNKLKSTQYNFILVNYANSDMVGHTGNFDAAKKAVEVVDECVGRLVASLLEIDAHILITADHGNAEQMVDYNTGMVQTSHTKFPVECIYVASDTMGKQLKTQGKLSDIAPTVLSLFGLNIPKEMTSDSLL